MVPFPVLDYPSGFCGREVGELGAAVMMLLGVSLFEYMG